MCQHCGLRILIIDEDQYFLTEITQALAKLEIAVETDRSLPEKLSHDFYILGSVSNFCSVMDKIRSQDQTGKIFLAGSSCEKTMSARKLIKYDIKACIDKSNSGISELLKVISKLCKARKRIRNAGERLDRINKEMLELNSSIS